MRTTSDESLCSTWEDWRAEMDELLARAPEGVMPEDVAARLQSAYKNMLADPSRRSAPQLASPTSSSRGSVLAVSEDADLPAEHQAKLSVLLQIRKSKLEPQKQKDRYEKERGIARQHFTVPILQAILCWQCGLLFGTVQLVVVVWFYVHTMVTINHWSEWRVVFSSWMLVLSGGQSCAAALMIFLRMLGGRQKCQLVSYTGACLLLFDLACFFAANVFYQHALERAGCKSPDSYFGGCHNGVDSKNFSAGKDYSRFVLDFWADFQVQCVSLAYKPAYTYNL
jgi:hypothetical protein